MNIWERNIDEYNKIYGHWYLKQERVNKFIRYFWKNKKEQIVVLFITIGI